MSKNDTTKLAELRERWKGLHSQYLHERGLADIEDRHYADSYLYDLSTSGHPFYRDHAIAYESESRTRYERLEVLRSKMDDIAWKVRVLLESYDESSVLSWTDGGLQGMEQGGLYVCIVEYHDDSKLFTVDIQGNLGKLMNARLGYAGFDKKLDSTEKARRWAEDWALARISKQPTT